MLISSFPQQKFNSVKELNSHLVSKIITKFDLIFAQKKFDIQANFQLVEDGVKLSQAMIRDLSEVAFLQGRVSELERMMERVVETVSFNIMEKSVLVFQMNKIISSHEEDEKKLHKIKQKIVLLENQTTQKLTNLVSPFIKGSSIFDHEDLRKIDQSLKNTNKIHQKEFVKNVEIIIARRQASMRLMHKYLALAEKKGCTPDQVTQKDLKEYEQEEMRRNEAELLAMDKPKKGKKQAKKTTSKVSNAVKGTFQEKKGAPKVSPRDLPVPVQKDLEKPKEFKSPGKVKSQAPKKEQILQARTEFMVSFHQKSISEAFRVFRWQEKNPDNIREFTDRDKTGKVVKKYAYLDNEEIARQRTFHYLPGCEQLLNKKYRDIYTFPTNKGCGVYASLFLDDQEWAGFLYFGEGKQDQKVYHKYFESNSYETKDLISYFKDTEEIEEKEEENGIWKSEKETFITEINEEGVLTVKFIDESHFIKIYPLKKELFPEICFKR